MEGILSLFHGLEIATVGKVGGKRADCTILLFQGWPKEDHYLESSERRGTTQGSEERAGQKGRVSGNTRKERSRFRGKTKKAEPNFLHMGKKKGSRNFARTGG